MYATYAAMSMTPQQAILTVALSPEPLSKTFPMTGCAPSVA